MLKRIILSNWLLYRIAQWYIRQRSRKHYNISFGRKISLGFSSTFEGRHAIGNESSFQQSHLGYGSYLGENCTFYKTRIGRFCSIGSDVKCIYGKHPSNTFVSTHPSFFSLRKQAGFTFVNENKFEEFETPLDEDGKYSIEIGNDVWIGNHVKLMDGVRIGDGAIIATNTLVLRDVEPYSIVGGSPGKHIRFRFNEDQRKFLSKFKWWDKESSWIAENASHFVNVDEFIKKFCHA